MRRTSPLASGQPSNDARSAGESLNELPSPWRRHGLFGNTNQRGPRTAAKMLSWIGEEKPAIPIGGRNQAGTFEHCFSRKGVDRCEFMKAAAALGLDFTVMPLARHGGASAAQAQERSRTAAKRRTSWSSGTMASKSNAYTSVPRRSVSGRLVVQAIPVWSARALLDSVGVPLLVGFRTQAEPS